jgi:hypothetical protein
MTWLAGDVGQACRYEQQEENKRLIRAKELKARDCEIWRQRFEAGVEIETYDLILIATQFPELRAEFPNAFRDCDELEAM